MTKIVDMSDGEVLAEICHLLDEAGQDERRVVLFLLRRIVALGQRSYGLLDLLRYPKDPLTERAEESGDLLVYSAIADLQREVTR